MDDNILYDKEIVRIRDVFLKFNETLEMEDQVIQKIFQDKILFWEIGLIRKIETLDTWALLYMMLNE